MAFVRFKVDGLDCQNEVRALRAAVGPIVGGDDRLSFDIKAGTEGYPPTLETLVEGVTKAGDATGIKLKFLRRIPIDPMTRSTEWGMRAYGDKADSTAWGGGNVFDVYTKSTGKALDGTKYKDW